MSERMETIEDVQEFLRARVGKDPRTVIDDLEGAIAASLAGDSDPEDADGGSADGPPVEGGDVI